MKYIASVKDEENKIVIIEGNDYKTKKDFKADLKRNGYKVSFIATEDTFDEECEKYHLNLEKKRNIQKQIREGRKEGRKGKNKWVIMFIMLFL